MGCVDSSSSGTRRKSASSSSPVSISNGASSSVGDSAFSTFAASVSFSASRTGTAVPRSAPRTGRRPPSCPPRRSCQLRPPGPYRRPQALASKPPFSFLCSSIPLPPFRIRANKPKRIAPCMVVYHSFFPLSPAVFPYNENFTNTAPELTPARPDVKLLLQAIHKHLGRQAYPLLSSLFTSLITAGMITYRAVRKPPAGK